MYGVELMLIIVATLAHALTSSSPSVNIVGAVIFWRVLMGIGIGGDYPLSSIITSEFATTKWRGAMMGSVFAMQGIGQLTAAIIMIIVTAGFKESLETSTKVSNCTGVCALAVDKMWRTLIGFGAVPGCIALYYRLTIPETPRYTFDVQRDVEKADQDAKYYVAGKHGNADVDEIARIAAAKSATEMQIPKASFGDFMRHYAIPKNGLLLAGTALSWFFLDVAYYGLSLNNATILGAIGYSTTNVATTYEYLYKTAVGNLIIVLAGAVPGYWVTVATVDTIGRKPIQLGGFAILTVLFIAMGFGYDKLGANGLLGIYVVAQFFFNFGPNSTTFIVPGECFPTRYRSTSHGISAASGKIGSIIGKTGSLNLFFCAQSSSKARGLTNPPPPFRPRCYRPSTNTRCHHCQCQPLAQPRPRDLLAVHASRVFLDIADSRDQEEDARGACRRGRLRHARPRSRLASQHQGGHLGEGPHRNPRRQPLNLIVVKDCRIIIMAFALSIVSMGRPGGYSVIDSLANDATNTNFHIPSLFLIVLYLFNFHIM